MRWLVNYIRQMFCQHDWELLAHIHLYETDQDTRPYGSSRTYRCKKCGFVQRVKE